jgi:precorrin-6A/cobalt-precorrin-6A reductase
LSSATGRRRVLVLGGTSEARELASALDRAGFAVVSSLAGRVAAPRLPAGEVRTGGFGGPDGLARWLVQHDVAAVVDATHPFAERISTSAATACASTNVPLLLAERPHWSERPGDLWHRVDGLRGAAALLPRIGSRVLLTIGRQGVSVFAEVAACWFLIRCIEPPEPPLPPHYQVLLGRGPHTLDGELTLLDHHEIDVIVTKDSGGAPTEAKLEAARIRGLPVVVVRRPPRPDVPSVPDVAGAVAWVRSVLHSESLRAAPPLRR